MMTRHKSLIFQGDALDKHWVQTSNPSSLVLEPTLSPTKSNDRIQGVACTLYPLLYLVPPITYCHSVTLSIVLLCLTHLKLHHSWPPKFLISVSEPLGLRRNHLHSGHPKPQPSHWKHPQDRWWVNYMSPEELHVSITPCLYILAILFDCKPVLSESVGTMWIDYWYF